MTFDLNKMHTVSILHAEHTVLHLHRVCTYRTHVPGRTILTIILATTIIYYSGFEATCPDCDLKSALDHAYVINECYSSSFRIRNSNCVSILRSTVSWTESDGPLLYHAKGIFQ